MVASPTGPRADYGHGAAGLELGDFGAPLTRCYDVSQEERIFVRHVVRNDAASLFGKRDAHELRLAAVYAAAQLPPALYAVVHPAAFAVKAFAAKCLAAYGHAVAGG